MNRLVLIIILVFILTSCNFNNDINVDFTNSYNLTQVQELSDITYDDDLNEMTVTIKVGEARDVMINQLCTPTFNTGGQTIGISSSQVTEEAYESSIGLSIGASVSAGFDTLFGGVEVSMSLETSTSLSTTHSTASETGETTLVSLDQYEKEKYYTIILVGSYDVYEIFKIDLFTNTATKSIKTIGVGQLTTRVVSSTTNEFNYDINVNEVLYEELDSELLFENGLGIENDPYIIRNQFEFLSMFLYPDKNYKLDSDIYLGDLEYIPQVDFTGVLDGNNHTLTDLNIEINRYYYNWEISHNYFGLFRTIEGEVKNLKLYNFYYNFESYHLNNAFFYIGTLTGKTTETAIIDNVLVDSAYLNIHRDRSASGGIIGEHNGLLTNSQVTYIKMFSNGDMGGIVGHIKTSGQITYSKLTSKVIDEVTYNSVFDYYYVNNPRATGGIVANILNTSVVDYPLLCVTNEDSIVFTNILISNFYYFNQYAAINDSGVSDLEYCPIE